MTHTPLPNVFETGQRKVVPAVLIYAERQGKILMLHRNAKHNDYHEGKWNGLGGKCEADESFLETAVRELEEESGLRLDPTNFHALGILQFPNFKRHKNEDWLVAVFSAKVPHEDPSVQPWNRGPEGDLVWIPSEELLNLNLWQGDRFFIPYVLSGKPFLGTIWYEGEQVIRRQVTEMGRAVSEPTV